MTFLLGFVGGVDGDEGVPRWARRAEIRVRGNVQSGRGSGGPEPVKATGLRSGLREFRCSVVTETVLIRLTRSKRLTRLGDYFVQCNQADCQYVEANVAPCPLRVEMFADQIRAAEISRAARRESY